MTNKNKNWSRRDFMKIAGAGVKANILKADYSKAEKYCPQKIQISKVLKKTYEELA